jgi:hypothetical protein
MDVFKLPGDRLTATSAIKHHIPTPSIPHNRVITIRNYRIPEQNQRYVDDEIHKMLEGIIEHSKNPFNFPMLVVPKKSEAAGKRK